MKQSKVLADLDSCQTTYAKRFGVSSVSAPAGATTNHSAHFPSLGILANLRSTSLIPRKPMALPEFYNSALLHPLHSVADGVPKATPCLPPYQERHRTTPLLEKSLDTILDCTH